MLRIYLSKPENVVDFNDAWFDSKIYDMTFDVNVKNIIKHIDAVEYLGGDRIKSKFSEDLAISVKELSSGCKTAINVAYFPDRIFNLAECGDNAMQVIFNFKRGNVYLPYFILPREFKNDIEVIYNNKKQVVHNNNELESLLNDIF